VIVAGVQKVQPGMTVRAMEAPVKTALAQLSHGEFFIDRPIFAIVIAILIMLGGGLSIATLPIEQVPPIAPPTVQIGTTYSRRLGADGRDTVVQVIGSR